MHTIQLYWLYFDWVLFWIDICTYMRVSPASLTGDAGWLQHSSSFSYGLLEKIIVHP